MSVDRCSGGCVCNICMYLRIFVILGYDVFVIVGLSFVNEVCKDYIDNVNSDS